MEIAHLCTVELTQGCEIVSAPVQMVDVQKQRCLRMPRLCRDPDRIRKFRKRAARSPDLQLQVDAVLVADLEDRTVSIRQLGERNAFPIVDPSRSSRKVRASKYLHLLHPASHFGLCLLSLFVIRKSPTPKIDPADDPHPQIVQTAPQVGKFPPFCQKPVQIAEPDLQIPKTGRVSDADLFQKRKIVPEDRCRIECDAVKPLFGSWELRVFRCGKPRFRNACPRQNGECQGR